MATSAQRKPRVICAVVIAHVPENSSGNTWAFLNWALGLRDSGCDVWLVEHLDRQSLKHPPGGGESTSLNEQLWQRIIDEFGFAGRATLFLDDAADNADDFTRWAAEADALINLSGQFKLHHRVAHVPRRAYVDLDPAFTQLWAATLDVDMNFDGHTDFFSVGNRLAEAHLPDTGRKWQPTLTPVSLAHWTSVEDAPLPVDPSGCWTTVTHWHGYKTMPWEGRLYGDKRESLVGVRDLPRGGARLLVATDMQPDWTDYQEFSAAGWSFIDAAKISADARVYRKFLAAGIGEFSVAKQGYTLSRCGWFSDRSACYLALGRPVVLEETGWSEALPSGDGLRAWGTVDEAANALQEMERDLPRHRAAARRIAEEFLDARKVVAAFLARLRIHSKE
ncbi:hypothetical protein AYO41_00100 [Verrucomicrobia bacterium SCGC AG-212-E04]|nr:hypothetical protein AYO41_00100 [Verrucomicrobia bacterium SCGC AG-212-E04]